MGGHAREFYNPYYYATSDSRMRQTHTHTAIVVNMDNDSPYTNDHNVWSGSSQGSQGSQGSQEPPRPANPPPPRASQPNPPAAANNQRGNNMQSDAFETIRLSNFGRNSSISRCVSGIEFCSR